MEEKYRRGNLWKKRKEHLNKKTWKIERSLFSNSSSDFHIKKIIKCNHAEVQDYFFF